MKEGRKTYVYHIKLLCREHLKNVGIKIYSGKVEFAFSGVNIDLLCRCELIGIYIAYSDKLNI